MFRHKVLIQGARIAYGFSGIYDEDEAQRIIEGEFSQESGNKKALAFMGGRGKSEQEVTPSPAITVSDDIKNQCHESTLSFLESGDAEGMKKLWSQYDADTHAVLWKLFNSSQRSAITKLIGEK
jgi:hypothetical protein